MSGILKPLTSLTGGGKKKKEEEEERRKKAAEEEDRKKKEAEETRKAEAMKVKSDHHAIVEVNHFARLAINMTAYLGKETVGSMVFQTKESTNKTGVVWRTAYTWLIHETSGIESSNGWKSMHKKTGIRDVSAAEDALKETPFQQLVLLSKEQYAEAFPTMKGYVGKASRALARAPVRGETSRDKIVFWALESLVVDGGFGSEFIAKLKAVQADNLDA